MKRCIWHTDFLWRYRCKAEEKNHRTTPNHNIITIHREREGGGKDTEINIDENWMNFFVVVQTDVEDDHNLWMTRLVEERRQEKRKSEPYREKDRNCTKKKSVISIWMNGDHLLIVCVSLQCLAFFLQDRPTASVILSNDPPVTRYQHKTPRAQNNNRR